MLIIVFKAGKDLGQPSGNTPKVSCVACDALVGIDRLAYAGWQQRPAVCPDCLRWVPVDAEVVN